MLKHFGTVAAAGFVALLLGGQKAMAQADGDTVRLGGNIEAKTTTLSYDGLSDTILTRGVRGGFGGGRGGFGGGRVAFGGARVGFVGGRVGFAGGRVGFGGVRVGIGFGGYGYGGYGYGYGGYGYGGYGYGWPYYYPSYYPSYIYSSPSYYYPQYYPAPAYYAPASGYYPVSATTSTGGAAVYRPALSAEQLPPPVPATTVPMRPADGGTYLYDGGPVNPVPMPTAPQTIKIAPVESRFVSIPATKGSGFAYPAYGDRK